MFVIFLATAAVVGLYVGRWAYAHRDEIARYRECIEAAERENGRE